MTNAKAANRWLWTARVITALYGLTLLVVYVAGRGDKSALVNAWAATLYILLFALLLRRPTANIALGLILLAEPTVLFVCFFPPEMAWFMSSKESEWVRSLVIIALITASQAALIGVAIKWLERDYGRETTWILILTGGAACGVSIIIAIWSKDFENIALLVAAPSLPLVVSAVAVLVSLEAPRSRGHWTLWFLLVAFGIAASGITYFRCYLEQRECANSLSHGGLFSSYGIPSSIRPPSPIDWAVVLLPTLLAGAGAFMSLTAPNSREQRRLRISLVVLGIVFSVGIFFWQMILWVETPCFSIVATARFLCLEWANLPLLEMAV